MKIGVAQLNFTVGDIDGNREKILNAYHELCKQGAELVIYSELAVCGYPPRDLLYKSDFIKRCKDSLRLIAEHTQDIPILIGFPEKITGNEQGLSYNAVAWCEQGDIKHIGHKCLLPAYDVFEEKRYFKPADESLIVSWRGLKIGITICEDIWTGDYANPMSRKHIDPVDILSRQNIDLFLNLSASPWHMGKRKVRQSLVSSIAVRCSCPVVYCNQVGGNDSLIFDGRSMITNKTGEIIKKLKSFEEDICLIDVDHEHEIITEKTTVIESIYKALILGLKDYTQKIGFTKAILGLSGGIDSAVVAVLAKEALGPHNVTAISLPSAISSEHSKTDAKQLAKNLGIHFQTLSIAPLVESSLRILSPIFENYEPDTTEENIQARCRGLLLMAVSNKTGSLLLSTGNKSEHAVGYCTLYGDMAGGLAVISDVTKMTVYKLAEYINKNTEVIPVNILTKPPSAELRVGQLDQDSLPNYDILDRIVCLYVENHWGVKEISQEGFDENIVRDIIARIDRNEYKREQAPPGLKITPHAFGIGRRMPIAQKYIN